MGATFSRTKTWSAGDILTAADQNAEFDNILNNLTTAGMDDYSANVTEMRATTDPYPSGAESLATSLQGEITRLRYVVKQITGEAQWMIDPDTDLAALQAAKGAASGLATLDANSKVVQESATKFPSVQSVVTGSRVLGTAYQNTTGRPMWVSVSAWNDTAGRTLSGYTDASNPPTTEVKKSQPANTYVGTVGFFVLVNNYYKVQFESGVQTLTLWTEWY